MSVLIKDMAMPKSCAECALNYDCFKCIVTGTPFFGHEHPFDDETTRLDNCPLITIPPHGDLIDRDALPTSRVEWEDIINAPTIIPADEPKEE